MLFSLLGPSSHSGSLSPLFRSSEPGYNADMESIKYIYWQDENHWLGYLQDYPDYWTQRESLEDLQAHLEDLYRDLPMAQVLSRMR